jgi:hypothetical protein
MGPLPGSTHVLSRASNQLVPCNPVLCPSADAIVRPDPDNPQQIKTVYVNRMMYGGGGGVVYSASSLGSPNVQRVGQIAAVLATAHATPA